MALSNPFTLGKRYNFELYPNAIMPTKVTNARVTSIVSGNVAEQLNYQVATKHAQMFASLPEETSEKDFTSQLYVLVEYPNGNTDAIGLSWIRYPTIKLLSVSNYTVELLDVTPESAEALSQVLAANGYRVKRIQQVERDHS